MYTSKFKMTLPVQEAGTLKKKHIEYGSFFKDKKTVLSLVILEKPLQLYPSFDVL